eukprot:Pgem_evm1s12842
MKNWNLTPKDDEKESQQQTFKHRTQTQMKQRLSDQNPPGQDPTIQQLLNRVQQMQQIQQLQDLQLQNLRIEHVKQEKEHQEQQLYQQQQFEKQLLHQEQEQQYLQMNQHNQAQPNVFELLNS